MIRFTARDIAAFSDDFSDDFVVFNIFFEEFNSEEGGESWNFQRALGADGTIESLGEEDEGVCVVKEIQQLVFNKSIQEVELSRGRFVCKFDPEGKNQISKWLNKGQRLYSDASKTIRNHLEGICQYFANRVTSGIMEGINNRIKAIKRQGYSFTNIANFRARLLAAFWP